MNKNGAKPQDEKSKKWQRNKAKILSCKLHSFDCAAAIKREKAKQEKFCVIMPLSPISIRCRCKNCGGTMSLLYAMPYMEALNHVKRREIIENEKQ